MTRTSYKSKLYLAAGGFVAASGLLFGYVFGLIDGSNQRQLEALAVQKKELVELETEQKNFELSRKDLTQLAAKPYQPQDLFSSDTKLVGEIKALEQAAKESSVTLTLSVSGKVATAAKAKTISEIFVIPYTMQVRGSYANVIQFLERVEHLSFVTHVKGVTINTASGGEVNAILSTSFYVRK